MNSVHTHPSKDVKFDNIVDNKIKATSLALSQDDMDAFVVNKLSLGLILSKDTDGIGYVFRYEPGDLARNRYCPIIDNLKTYNIKDFIKKYAKEHTIENYPFVLVEVDKKQSFFSVRFMTKNEFVGIVGCEDELLFLDGGLIEDRKIILAYETGHYIITNIPLSCARMVEGLDKDLYQIFVEINMLRNSAGYVLRHDLIRMLGGATVMHIKCNKKGKIEKITYQNKVSSPILRELKRRGIPFKIRSCSYTACPDIMENDE